MSSLFPPREPAIPEPGDWELNRGRVELRFISACEPTDPEQVGFPSARQIASLTRLVLRKDKTGKDKKSQETVRLITSLDAQQASGKDLKRIKRDYWGIESKLHYRLDNVLDEDRSRVQNPNAALVLGMFRRVVVSFAIPWHQEKKKTDKRTSTRSFLDHLNADNHRRAFDLVTCKVPTAWKN
jgi:predicted transposase YbfD/YdcC